MLKSHQCSNVMHSSLYISSNLSSSLFCVYTAPVSLLDKSHRQTRQSANPKHKPPSLLNLLIRNHTSSIPNQMPQTIERVKHKWPSDRKLRRNLQQHWPSSEASSQNRSLNVPTKRRSDQVKGTIGVEKSAHSAAGDTVQCGQVPGDLRFVDCEVRSHGAGETLFGEDLGGCLVGGDGRCCCQSKALLSVYT